MQKDIYKKKNLLLLGASGGLASAFLQEFQYQRDELIHTLVLLDKEDSLLRNPYLDHKKLSYIFLNEELAFPDKTQAYITILQKYHIDLVIDLTDVDTPPIYEATDSQHVSYLNTAMNHEIKTSHELVVDVYKQKDQPTNAPHLLCSGMNPGIVNMWVQEGVEEFGIPENIVHFEFDSSTFVTGWKPTITWSKKEFLVEAIKDPSGIMHSRDEMEPVLPNGLSKRTDMTALLSPLIDLRTYPKGMQILHEENVSVAMKYNIPSQFIYAIHPKTMDYLEKLYAKKQDVDEDDLIHVTNTDKKLSGYDMVCVRLEYSDKDVYYSNTMYNADNIGTSATYKQVVVGLYAGAMTLLREDLLNKVYFVEDLPHTLFSSFMHEHMVVEKKVVEKTLDNSLSDTPETTSLLV